MFGHNEIIIFAMYEESWNECFLHMFSNRIQVFDIEIVLYSLRNTLSFIVDFTKLRAILLKTARPPPNL
jgi:hypothetical protein